MITFIIPTRNNLPYVQLAYKSIRNFYSSDEIIILDDNSSDGTQSWLKELVEKDKKTIMFSHTGRQVGHTVLYDIGVGVAHNDIFTIFHADMVCGRNYVENLVKHLKPGTVVAATRIEPPLHPAGKEKIIQNFGIYSEDFKQQEFNNFVLQQQKENLNQITKGIFAPWAMYKKDFLSIGGHDKLFSPFPYEDSDIFQRFILAGYDIKQSRDAFVYHFTCRGHRWTKEVQKDDLFYKLCCAKNASHFIRKWGHWIENDENSYPIIHKKYDIGVVIENCNEGLIQHIEPWFSTVYIDGKMAENYIKTIQAGTPFDMKKRVKDKNVYFPTNDIVISFDCSQMTQERLQTLTMLPKMIEDSGEEGIMEFDIFRIEVNSLNSKEKQLVNNHSKYYEDQLISKIENDPYYTDELFKVFNNVKDETS